MDPRFWMNLLMQYERAVAAGKGRGHRATADTRGLGLARTHKAFSQGDCRPGPCTVMASTRAKQSRASCLRLLDRRRPRLLPRTADNGRAFKGASRADAGSGQGSENTLYRDILP